MLDVRAADRRGRLRAQRERPIGAIGERVHLLLDDVRARAGRPLEERRVLEDRRLDRAVAVERAQALDLRRDARPERLLGRDDVVRAARSLDSCLPAHSAGSARRSARNGFRASSVAERRDRPVAGVHDRLGRQRVDEHANRREQRVPVGSRKVRAPDRPGEEHVAGEERAVRVVGDVSRRVAGDGEDVEGDACDLEQSRRRRAATSGVCARSVSPTGVTPSGLSRSIRSPSGMCTGAPVPSARSATPSRWSKWPCVTRIAAHCAPSRASVSLISVASPLGSTTTASLEPASRPGRCSSSSRSVRARADRREAPWRSAVSSRAVRRTADARRGAGPSDRRSDRGSS